MSSLISTIGYIRFSPLEKCLDTGPTPYHFSYATSAPTPVRWPWPRYSDYSEILQRGPWTFVKSTHGPDFADFALRHLGFSEINLRSMNFQLGLKFEKYLQKGP
jgi:hypothetical protein